MNQRKKPIFPSVYHSSTCYVHVKGEKVNEKEVEVLNIEEDIQGRDLLTFKYKGKKYTSCRVE